MQVIQGLRPPTTFISGGPQASHCVAPEIKVVGGRRPWITCINMGCPKKEEQRQAAAAKAEADGKDDGSTEGGERSSKTTRKKATSKSSAKTKKKPAGTRKSR